MSVRPDMVCSASGAYLSLSIAFNAITLHATCTVVWVVVAAVVAFAFASIQTLHRVAILGWVGLVSIFAAVIACAVAVAIRDRPALAPPYPEPFNINIRAFHKATFAAAANQIGSTLCESAKILVRFMNAPVRFVSRVVAHASLGGEMHDALNACFVLARSRLRRCPRFVHNRVRDEGPGGFPHHCNRCANGHYGDIHCPRHCRLLLHR